MGDGNPHEDDVLKIAAALHGYHTGAFPDLEQETRSHYCMILRKRLLNWESTDRMYDESIRQLLIITMSEIEGWVHMAPPNWNTYCGLHPWNTEAGEWFKEIVAYDTVSIEEPIGEPGGCPSCPLCARAINQDAAEEATRLKPEPNHSSEML